MTRRSTSCVLAAAVLACSTPLALAQEAGEAPPPPPPEGFGGGAVLVIDHAELSQFLPDDRDKGLLRAFQMLPARIGELPREAGDDFTGEVAGAVNTIITALARPGRLAVMYDETPTGGMFGYGVMFSVQTQDRAEAQTLQTRIRSMLRDGNPNLQLRPSQRFKGMSDLQLPFGVLSMGPREAADGWRYEVILGTMPDPDSARGVFGPVPQGVTPVVRAYFNTRGLAPALDMVESMAGGGGDLPPQLAAAGAMVRRGLVTTYDAGFTKDALVSRMVVQGARGAADQLLIGTEPLTGDDLRVIPPDATNAYIRRLHEGWASSFVQTIASTSPEVEGGIQQFEQVTGVNVYDLAAAIGDRVCVYTSDMTGGGGLGSAVALVSIADREKLQDSLSGLIEFVNEQGREQAKGYVQVRAWEDGGTTLYSLRFPGLPVPVELSLAVTEQWLIMAPLPQSALAASRQIAGGSPGLVPSARTAGFIDAEKPMVEFSYTDAGRSLAAGYPWLCMLGAGVANMVRSPSDPEREPGMVIPLYNELVSGVRPSIKTTVWNGDDLVTESASSRSTVVNLGATFGTLSKFLPLVAAGAAAAAAEERRFGLLEGGDSPVAALAVLAMPLPDRLALEAAARLLPADRLPSYVEAVLNAPAAEAGR